MHRTLSTRDEDLCYLRMSTDQGLAPEPSIVRQPRDTLRFEDDPTQGLDSPAPCRVEVEVSTTWPNADQGFLSDANFAPMARGVNCNRLNLLVGRTSIHIHMSICTSISLTILL